MQPEPTSSAGADPQASSSSQAGMKAVRNGSKPTVKGLDAWLTGAGRIDSPFQAEGDDGAVDR